jgi:site-specific DNA-methyltransferase (adenine-specific)
MRTDSDQRGKIFVGDCVRVMQRLPAASVHAIVTDPPYGLGFESWVEFKPEGFDRRTRSKTKLKRAYANLLDRGPSQYVGGEKFQQFCTAWGKEALRVLVPGGHLVAFGGPRTYHRLACGLEDAGFVVRDCLMWLYGSGFPKSLNIAQTLRAQGFTAEAEEWAGWGTGLKPAWEPIVLVRKQPQGTVAETVRTYGTGALHIDAARIRDAGEHDSRRAAPAEGRWPANVLLTHAPGCGTVREPGLFGERETFRCVPDCPIAVLDDASPGAARFFYTAKASVRERMARGRVSNEHPTVKPVELMRWLIRLVVPQQGTVLDPFCGSGSTLVAAFCEGRTFVGIEHSELVARVAAERVGLGADALIRDSTETHAHGEGDA